MASTQKVSLLLYVCCVWWIPREATAQCNDLCTREYTPVCGSDGQTYSNPCDLELRRCQDSSNLTKAYGGECTTVAPLNTECPEVCTEDFIPVCGSDGTTYSNNCSLRMAICTNSTGLTRAYDGRCTSDAPFNTNCTEACTADFVMVCGSDGITYLNNCSLQMAICSNPNLTKAYDGVCTSDVNTDCDWVCLGDYDTVCGSDGKTYFNDCYLWVEKKCKNPNVTKAYDGRCTSVATKVSLSGLLVAGICLISCTMGL